LYLVFTYVFKRSVIMSFPASNLTRFNCCPAWSRYWLIDFSRFLKDIISIAMNTQNEIKRDSEGNRQITLALNGGKWSILRLNQFYPHRKKASRTLRSEGRLNVYYSNNGPEKRAGPWVSSFMGSRPLRTRFKMNKSKKAIRGMDCSPSSLMQILLVTCVPVHHWVHIQNT
jgi:hypothetical protein